MLEKNSAIHLHPKEYSLLAHADKMKKRRYNIMDIGKRDYGYLIVYYDNKMNELLGMKCKNERDLQIKQNKIFKKTMSDKK